jgi:spore coat protein U-like protein
MHALTLRLMASALVAATLALAAPSAAQSRRQTCNLMSSELAFGDYDVFDANPTEAVARIVVECDREASKIRPTIELSAGSSQTFARRTQISGSHALTYNIYADRGLRQIAGDGSSGTTVLHLEPFGEGPRTKKVDLYGAIDPRQFAPPGAYFDTIYVTLIF